MITPTPLLVFAHRDEAFAFSDVPHLVTGVGKIHAAVSLADALRTGEQVPQVVVLGTAGVVGDGERQLDLDTVYQVTKVVQHDYSLPSVPLHPSGEVILSATATMATGDVFVQDDQQRRHIHGLGADLVDMEGYAYVSLCERFGVPLSIFKIPSDFADSATTAQDWDNIVHRKSEQLREFWESAGRTAGW